MVINEIYFINKRERFIAGILSIFIVISELFAFTLLLILYKKINDQSTLVGVLIVGILALLSSFDIWYFVKRDKSIGLKVIWYYKKLKNKNITIAIHATELQNKITESICNDEKLLGSLIHIYGFSGKGKTTTAFFVLKGIFFSNSKNFSQVKEIIFIDCSLDKHEVLSLFGASGTSKRFNHTIVVLDNIEKMGRYFMEVNREIFASTKNLFILIEDDEIGIYSDILSPAKSLNFNSNKIELLPNSNWLIYITNLSDLDKYILFIIYFLVYSQKYSRVEYVSRICKISRKQILKLLKDMEIYAKEKNENMPFSVFPFNKEYIYCSNLSVLAQIPQEYKTTEIYKKALCICLQNNECLDHEQRWLCFIQNDYAGIELLSQDLRILFFNKALLKGHFKLLYDSLDSAIRLSPEKQSLLFYEYGVLCYYMGFHSKAFQLYQKHLKTITGDAKMRMLIRIIESVHGSSDDSVVLQIGNYMAELKADADYELYADYWQTHIGTEKGIFDIPRLRELCGLFKRIESHSEDFLHIETLKRCYTDLIRCHHILGIRPDKELESEFEDFLKSKNEQLYKYSFNLYIKAGNLQYIDIPNSDFEKIGTDVPRMVCDANQYYEDAIASEYTDRKSRLALSVKKMDLMTVYANANINEAIRTAGNFLVHAQNNNARLHEAYAHTVLAKFTMLDRCIQDESMNELQNVRRHIEEARKIYTEYKNMYGVFRLDFMLYLFMLYAEAEYINILNRMRKLTETNNCYPKEYNICIELIKRNNEKRLSKMYILWCIRSYMIVLQ